MGALRIAALLLSLASGGCTFAFTYPLEEAEDDAITCYDGRDNDFDGRIDCGDEDCLIDQCGPPPPPPKDELGRICSGDSACEPGELCNLAVERCIRRATPDENAFEIFFVTEMEGGRSSGRQNIQGKARFNGAEYLLDLASITPNQMEFAGEASGGRRAGVRIAYFEAPAPLPDRAKSYLLADRIEPESAGAEIQILAAELGYLSNPNDPLPLPLNLVAIVRTATLSFHPLSERTERYWAGTLAGRLREAVSYDRAYNSCPGGMIYHPDGGACRTFFEEFSSLFFLGCTLRATPATRGSGGMVHVWHPPWAPGARDSGSAGRCEARRESDGMRVRAVSPRDNRWGMEIWIQGGRLVSSVSLELGDAARVNIYPPPISPESRPLFELDFGPSIGALQGRLTIEHVSEGDDGLLMGWIEGS